jgi:gliding motility-associated-like protein
MMRKLTLLLFLLLGSAKLHAQLDTLFWFVAPEVAQSHGDRPIVFRFATLTTPATITVSQPANPGFPTQVLNLGVNAAQTLDLTPWIDIIENKPANSVLNYGFKIHATAPIMAYYEVVTSCNCNPDIFTLKGKNALGTSFIISSQTFLNNANYARSAFDIVATQANTSITIVPSNNIVGHPAGIPFNIVLNAGETFSAEASNIAGNLHLSGSTVVANKPIAITIKDDSMQGGPYGGCADLMGDQTIPVPVTGKEYITLKGYLNGPDKVYIVATQNNTQLSIDGANVGNLNATNLYVHTQSNPTAYIQSDKPVYVLHNTGFGCEVGGAIVPPIVCTGSNTVAFVRSTNESFALNILVPSGGQNSFTLNGSPANVGPGNFQPVPGSNNTWMYAQINGNAFIGVLTASRLENPSTKFHLGVIHGGANSGCRYGYFSDFAAYKYEIDAENDLLCSGDTLVLTADSLPGATYNWTGPLGIASIGSTLTLNGVVPAQSGNYIISGYNPGACELIPDTIAITIIATPTAPAIATNSPLCLGDTLEAQTPLNGAFTFHWEFNNALQVQNDSISVPNLSPGTYPITLYSNLGACISPTTYDTITVFTAPDVQFTGIQEVCGDQISFFTPNYTTDPNDPLTSFQWFNAFGSVGTGDSLPNVTSPSGAYANLNYWVTLTTNNGCTVSDTFSITYQPYPVAPLTVTTPCDGESAQFSSQLSWNSTPPPNTNCVYSLAFGDGQNSNTTNTSHVFDTTGNYTTVLTVTSAWGCATSDTATFTITAVPVVNPDVGATCGQLGIFSLELILDNYTYDALSWNIPGVGVFNATNFEHTFANPGDYIASVVLEGSNNCDYNTNIPFTILPSVTIENLSIPNVITPNGDQSNDELLLDNLFVDCTNYEMLILNRWGQVVYEGSNTSAPFNGIDIGGKALESGVYFFKLTTNDNKVVSGHLTLIR